MPNPTKSQLKQAENVITEIMLSPPSSAAEMKRRLKPVNKAAGCQILCALIADNEAARREKDIVMMLAEPLGLGLDAAPLIAIIEDSARGKDSRKLAILVLATMNISAISPETLDLDLDLLREMAGDTDSALLWPILEDPVLNGEVNLALFGAPAAERDELWQQIDKSRQRLLVPAWLAYADSLQNPALVDLHESMLAAITTETSATGVDVWDEIMAWDLPAKTWAIVQETVMRTRTARLNSPGKLQGHKPFMAPASAWISQCDGTGAFILFIRAQTQDGALNIYNICLRVSSDMRNGFVLANRSPEEFDDMLLSIQQELGFEFVRFPLADAVTIVGDVQDFHTKNSPAVEQENRRVLACMQWACNLGIEEKPGFRQQQLELPALDSRLDSVEAVKLFEHEDFRAWYLNDADLASLGFVAMDPSEDEGQWLKTESSRINTPEVRQRLQLMFEHMSWYYNWRQDLPMVQRCLLAGQLLASGPAEMLLLMQKYLIASLLANDSIAQEEGQSERFAVGDTAVRAHLRRVCFPRLTRPKGKHLAILDLTEAALLAVEKEVTSMAMHDRPILDTLPSIALAIAKAEVDMILSGRSGEDLPQDPKRFRRMLNAIRKESRLSLTAAEALWSATQYPLGSFVLDVCSDCQVGCLWRPTSDLSDWFEYPGHPAFAEESGDFMAEPVAEIYQLRITLEDSNPPVWRQVQVPSFFGLDQLHTLIQLVMGWENSHLHEFSVPVWGSKIPRQFAPGNEIEMEDTEDERSVTIGQLCPDKNDKLTYIYDFGDDWIHEVKVQKILVPESGVDYPRCVSGRRACPPEDCGGVHGYGHLLSVLTDPSNPEFSELADWSPDGFDSEVFDLAAVERKLRAEDWF